MDLPEIFTVLFNFHNYALKFSGSYKERKKNPVTIVVTKESNKKILRIEEYFKSVYEYENLYYEPYLFNEIAGTYELHPK